MTNPHTLFKIIEITAGLRHCSGAPAIKEAIGDIDRWVNELKKEWAKLAAEEYAMDVTFPKFEREFLASGHSKVSALEHIRKNKLWTDKTKSIETEYYKNLHWFERNVDLSL